MFLLWIFFVKCVFLCQTVKSVSCSLVLACWERADLLTFLYVMLSCVFVTFPFGFLSQVWYLIELILDLCLLPYLFIVSILFVTFEVKYIWHVILLTCLCSYPMWVFSTSPVKVFKINPESLQILNKDTTWESDKNAIKHHKQESHSLSLFGFP